MDELMNCYPLDQVLVRSTVADKSTRMAFMPVPPLRKSLTWLEASIRHLPWLADRAAGVADRGLSDRRDHLALVGGLK
jgi:hypothetical protein